MTLLDAQENLLEWFLEHEGFEPQVDFDNILEKISLTREEDKAMYYAALASLETTEVVIKLELPTGNIWKLTKPLRMRSQTFELSYPVAKAVANTINNFSEATGGALRVVESFNVGEREVVGLVDIIQTLSAMLKEEK